MHIKDVGCMFQGLKRHLDILAQVPDWWILKSLTVISPFKIYVCIFYIYTIHSPYIYNWLDLAAFAISSPTGEAGAALTTASITPL